MHGHHSKKFASGIRLTSLPQSTLIQLIILHSETCFRTGWLASAEGNTADKHKSKLSPAVSCRQAAPNATPSVPCAKPVLDPTACHTIASSDATPPRSSEHAYQLQPSSQTLSPHCPIGVPCGVPRGVTRGAGPSVSPELCQASQQPFKQSPAKASTAQPAEGRAPSRNDKKNPFKAPALTEQLTCQTASAKRPSAAAPLLVPLKHVAAEPQRTLIISEDEHKQLSVKHHEPPALQKGSLVTQQLPEKLTTAEHQQNQSPAEMHEAPGVSRKLPEKSSNQVAYVEHSGCSATCSISDPAAALQLLSYCWLQVQASTRQAVSGQHLHACMQGV